MPEIYEMFFGLSELFRFFPLQDSTVNEQIAEYETELAQKMAQNRIRLFGDYGYDSEFEKAYFE